MAATIAACVPPGQPHRGPTVDSEGACGRGGPKQIDLLGAPRLTVPSGGGTVSVVSASSTRARHEGLPDAMRAAVDAFAGHLAAERNRSVHTVRAYVVDVVSLLDHATRM